MNVDESNPSMEVSCETSSVIQCRSGELYCLKGNNNLEIRDSPNRLRRLANVLPLDVVTHTGGHVIGEGTKKLLRSC